MKPGPLHGIEELVRHHIATNQQNLQTAQQKEEPAYKGPTLPEIRQDPATQVTVSAIMDAIKTATPVFGQNPTNIPAAQDRLHPLLGNQQAGNSYPSFAQPVPAQSPYQQLLDQLAPASSMATGGYPQSRHPQPQALQPRERSAQHQPVAIGTASK